MPIRLPAVWRAALLAPALALSPGANAAATAEPPLVLEAKIPLGAVSGRIDHLAIDLKRGRLFVAELGNDSLGVVDVAARQVLRTITGLSEPQGDDADNVRLDAMHNRVLVGYGKGALAVIDPVNRAKLGDIRLPGHPESFQIAENGAQIFVNVPDFRQVAIVDPAKGAVRAVSNGGPE